ncbi:MAG: phosphoribosylglycinamide formyltransferase [Peptostreptococcaceae bacterium]|nr:phosphoribosylglycinamide formyltransferase [Peptostreptococcaceae bacterium]
MLRISVMVSGGGSNLQALIDAIDYGQIKDAEIVQVISSSPSAFALERAEKHNIKVLVIGKKEFPNEEERNIAILKALKKEGTDLVVLAGYMNIMAPELVKEYKGKIINIHPSLIPKFCGEGFYGLKVHEAVIKAGEKESGATVHYVDEGIDTGEIIIQEKVPVKPGDNPATLAARVLEIEHKILPKAILIWQVKGEE